MLKIRDLGIQVIPATMRPPEIGAGGGYDAACDNCSVTERDPGDKDRGDVDCDGCSVTDFIQPDYSKKCDDKCNDCSVTDRRARGASGFSDEAVAQLRRQLQDEIARP